ncbi:unnamed protein product [Rotaria socialis]|uniref:RING-type domain-containing protein n=1 Tax=Rotaria socialis TaxID=392032 RepID=A0A820DMX2_9BILA|nr:unnamed protein product [Rotaria socialis]CAF4234742.1 unnamed protein product [Rotaria socialis]
MSNESIQMMDFNIASDEDGERVETIASNSKDEQMTATVHENGYESECSSSTRSDEDLARSVLEIEADAFRRFIERQRTEVMFELRHIRLGERPVTGQPNRERIETFLNNIQEQQHQNRRVPSTRPAMPSAHIDDIDSLATRRCVSAALGSVAFRQDLESAIRRSITPRTVPSGQQVPRAPPIPETLVSSVVEQQQSAQITQISSDLPAPVLLVTREQQQQPSQINQTRTHEPFNIERHERELNAWQAITQLQREIIVLEISDLVHRQLVTSALESDFRQHLEQNIYTRLEQGAPTQQVDQPTPIVRTPRVPPAPAPIRVMPTTHGATSNVDALSTRLDSMQQMLQLMFSMQMDMQRSLRQEVASAMANSSSNSIVSTSQPMNAGHCTVCLNAIADTVLYRCGHLCVCYMCGLNLRESTSANGVKCPICRAPVDDILRVYRSSRDGE